MGSRPQLDVSDALLDPAFCDSTLQCLRRSEAVSAGGISQLSSETLGFAGVVVSDRGDQLNRDAAAERLTGSISIITKFRLRQAGISVTPDLVSYNGRQYTVTNVNDYTSYGAGFIEAVCDLVPLA